MNVGSADGGSVPVRFGQLQKAGCSAHQPADPLVLLLEEMVRQNASDLHITVGSPPRLRIDGLITDSATGTVLTTDDTRHFADSLLTEEQRLRLAGKKELDFSFTISDMARFRVNVYHQQDCVAMAIRRLPFVIRPLEELGLPPVVASLAERPRGLVLVTGPTGSGKSTTLAAMLDRINRGRHGHILTIEDPIEYVHEHRQCVVSQREVGRDTESFARALKTALRQDPDVILLGEMRDPETISAALTAAETGHLCLATLHTGSAAETVNRIVDAFPAHQQAQIRSQLASVLEGVVTQLLLPAVSGIGRYCAAEIMLCTSAVRACIREGRTHQLYSQLQTGGKLGMRTLNDALLDLYRRGKVRLKDCLQVSGDVPEFQRMIRELEGSLC
ncbi:MAG: type IV pilus twitching motility protein PilT [Gemmatimonadota bacterium]|nr:type IV pilus twitching motility protein PilT [Gemmatimonadota bacterium]